MTDSSTTDSSTRATAPYRIHNHTAQTLIVETFGDQKQFRLPPEGVSPRAARPWRVWAAADILIGGQRMWQLEPGFDVHVTEVSPGHATPRLHISGLGVRRTDLEPRTKPEREGDGVWLFREGEIWVTVLGAGITGLTAAHELVIRGFRVQVIEKAHGSPADEVDGETGVRRFERGLTSPDVGGIARTQWTTQPLRLGASDGTAPEVRVSSSSASSAPSSAPSPASSPAPAFEAMRSVHGDCLWFGAQNTRGLSFGDYSAFGVPWSNNGLDTTVASDLLPWLKNRSASEGRSVAAVQLVLVVYAAPAERDHRSQPDVASGYARLYEFLRYLEGNAEGVPALREALDCLQVLPTARIDVHEAPVPEVFVGLLVRIHENLDLVAGEHGFRFFPGFYRHLRDTMQRTPIFDPQTRTFTPRTTHDNLTEVNWQVVFDPARPYPASLSRRPTTAIGGMMDQYRRIRQDLGYRPIDLLRYLLRMLRYMTSSTKRRKTYYEDLSWWDFVSTRRFDDPKQDRFTFGARFEQALLHAPKALLAMHAGHADARTYGNTSVQLFMDQFGLHEQGDSTLSGPTSSSWLTHWRTYLEEQGVQFFLGEVTEITRGAGGRASAAIAFPGTPPATYLDGEAARQAGHITDHYYVSAMDIVGLARTTRAFRGPGDPARYGVLSELRKLVCEAGQERDLEDIAQVGRTGEGQGLADRFQTMTGIQFHYPYHISFANGHIYFAASPWGLSAISQIQYWGPFGIARRGRVVGNLSIDVGSWRAEGKHPDPNHLPRDEIAAEIHAQIQRSMHHGEHPPGRGPRYYHLDDHIGFGSMRPDHEIALVPRRNHAPILINVVGDWKNRPTGEPWAPNDVTTRGRIPGSGSNKGDVWYPEHGGYPVHFGNLVIAGIHMRTFTRMGTMEAANESARHAVNTILDHATSLEGRFVRLHEPQPAGLNTDRSTTPYGDYCNIWNPELYEFQDLEFLRLIDSHLMSAALATNDDAPEGATSLAPHLFDILRLDDLPDWLDHDRDALATLELIGNTLKAFDGASLQDLPSVLAVVDQVRKKLAHLFERPKP
jgi:NAD(P)-binding Rossmann-like domain